MLDYVAPVISESEVTKMHASVFSSDDARRFVAINGSRPPY